MCVSFGDDTANNIYCCYVHTYNFETNNKILIVGRFSGSRERFIHNGIETSSLFKFTHYSLFQKYVSEYKAAYLIICFRSDVKSTCFIIMIKSWIIKEEKS